MQLFKKQETDVLYMKSLHLFRKYLQIFFFNLYV